MWHSQLSLFVSFLVAQQLNTYFCVCVCLFVCVLGFWYEMSLSLNIYNILVYSKREIFHIKNWEHKHKQTHTHKSTYWVATQLKMTAQSELARLEKMQYQATKLVTGTLHFTSKDKLNDELGWESIKKRIDFLWLSLFQKIRLHLTRSLSRNFMLKVDWNNDKWTRSKGGYLPYACVSVCVYSVTVCYCFIKAVLVNMSQLFLLRFMMDLT